MSEWLFWKDAYLKEFEAKVLEIDGNKVILDKTCFYARGGGQPSDKGWLNGILVLDVQKRGKDIIHVLEREPDFKVSDKVKGKIDWERRYRIMRLHSAAHVISYVIVKNFGNVIFTGSQIYEDRARMDFNLPQFNAEVASLIEKEANEIVEKAIPIKTYFVTKEEVEKNPWLKRVDPKLYEKFDVLRVVEIEGLDAQLDGGTHVKNTKEIGRIKIVKRENKGKNNKRIYIQVEP